MTNASSKTSCARVILSMLIEGSRHDADDAHLHVVFSCHSCFFVVVAVIIIRLLFSRLKNYHNNSDDSLNDTRSFICIYFQMCM